MVLARGRVLDRHAVIGSSNDASGWRIYGSACSELAGAGQLCLGGRNGTPWRGRWSCRRRTLLDAARRCWRTRVAATAASKALPPCWSSHWLDTVASRCVQRAHFDVMSRVIVDADKKELGSWFGGLRRSHLKGYPERLVPSE